MKNIWKNLNKKAIVAVAVVGVLLLSLSASAFVFGWFGKDERPKANINQAKNETEITPKKVLEDLKDLKGRHERVLKLIQDKEYRISDFSKEFSGFCNQMLADFKAGNTELILPILHTHDLNNPELQGYLNLCAEMTKKYLTELLFYNGLNAWAPYYPTLNFQLYHIDYDDNPENGKEYVLFQGGYTNSKVSPDCDTYNIFKLNTCTHIGSSSVRELYDSRTKELEDNYTGIIKYKNKYYIYGIERSQHTINFKTWRKDFKGNFKSISQCLLFAKD